MTTIKLDTYGPIISDIEVGDEIYNKIISNNPETNQITIDMAGIISMTTYCSKQIFGRLFEKIGMRTFNRNIYFKNTTDDVDFLIQMGINSVNDH